MNLLQVQNGQKSFGARQLFRDETFAVNEGEHIGVIGPNGAGKSTLFKVLTAQESLDGGQVIRAKSLRLGYLAQDDDWAPFANGEAYLEHFCQMPLWELYRFAADLGLTNSHLRGPITNLSGGWRMRLKLVRLIGSEPNLMLLDEPTNYLDLETLLVLEQFLLGYGGAFLLISHDREFLRRVTDHTLEIETGEITKFNGNIDDYFEQKAMLQGQLEARAQSLSDKRSAILQFAQRFGAKATKAKQAQSRLKQLARMETIEIKPLANRAHLELPEPTPTGQSVMELTDVALGYPERQVLSDVKFRLKRGDHVAIVGFNGAGKSTLLKALAGEIKPLKGQLARHTPLGYYAQHVAENLDPEMSVLQALGTHAHPETARQQVRDLAGALLFSGDDIEKKVRVLSGGEKSRVALGRILLMRAPLLLLDEPTNHLDFSTVEALTQALSQFSGTVVVVSHERSFIRRVAKQIIEIRDGKLELYPGSYDEYVWSLQKGVLRMPDHESRAEVKAEPEAKLTSHQERKLAQKRSAELEKRVKLLEAQMAKLNDSLAQLNQSIVDGIDVVANTERMVVCQRELNQIEEEWFKALES